MEVHEISIDGLAVKKMGFEPITIVPIGDVQLGSDGVDLSEFKRVMDWGRERNAYYVYMGDAVDIASPSNRQKLKAAGFYDSIHKALEDQADKYETQFLKLVDGTQGRWLGGVIGHHWFEHSDGTTTDTRIAQALKMPLLGHCGMMRLRFQHSDAGGRRTLTIWAHHGSGGGQKMSAPLNKLENLAYAFDADIYLIGHMSKRVIAPLNQIYMTDREPYKLKHRVKYIAGTGAFTVGYAQGSRQGNTPFGSYIEQKMLTPVSIGAIAFTVIPKRSHGLVDLHVTPSFI
jgi:hypothetical protein